MKTISLSLGEPAITETNEACSSGAITFTSWGNGFIVNAKEGAFVGWSTRLHTLSPMLTTAEGVGIGKSRSQLEAAHDVDVQESSLGIEFDTEDSIFGTLSSNESNAEITYLGAGIPCNF